MQKTDVVIHMGKRGNKKTDMNGNVIDAKKDESILIQVDYNKYKLQWVEGDKFETRIFGTYLWAEFDFKKNFTATKSKKSRFKETETVKARKSKSGLPIRHKKG